MNLHRLRQVALLLLAAYALLGAGGYADGGWNYQASSISPDGRFRVDLYSGRRWQRLGYAPWFEQPGFARISRTADGAALATSRVIDLSDSPVTWVPAGALVAAQTEYRHATRRWD